MDHKNLRHPRAWNYRHNRFYWVALGHGGLLYRSLYTGCVLPVEPFLPGSNFSDSLGSTGLTLKLHSTRTTRIRETSFKRQPDPCLISNICGGRSAKQQKICHVWSPPNGGRMKWSGMKWSSMESSMTWELLHNDSKRQWKKQMLMETEKIRR